MRKLLNTLYVLSEDLYLALDNENVVAKRDGEIVGRIPLRTLESIVSFSYMGSSPKLMGACADHHVALSFFTPNGSFLARVQGRQQGNVLLRKRQYSISDDESASVALARNMIAAKLYNSRWVLERACRDHGMRIDSAKVKDASCKVNALLQKVRTAETLSGLRGLEGDAAATYFGVFNELILRDKDFFAFAGRTKRPPTEPINAMLSLFYVVLSNDCAAALEGVGLDPYVGFLHADRPGRKSLALDLVEEFRAVMVDRFVLTAINNKVIDRDDFHRRETGEVMISDGGRKKLFDAWQQRKREMLTHPFLGVKMERGLIPHAQSLLLARFVRGDLDGYPPFKWK